MKLLGFDTSLNKTYITLSYDGEVVESRTIENKNGKYHSAYLISSLIEILQERAIDLKKVDMLAVNVGPGSFTGIRACVTVARVIAQQLEKKIIGVSSLEILSGINGSGKDALVVMDARKQECYMGVYASGGGEKLAPAIFSVDEMLEAAKKDYFIIADKSMSELLEKNGITNLCYESEDYDIGGFLNKIAVSKYQSGEGIMDWYNLKPLYIQKPPISKPKACVQ